MAVEIFTARGAIAGTFTAGAMVAGQAGDQYYLPATLVPEGDDFDLRVETDKRALADGAAAWGGQVESRKFTLSGLIGDGAGTEDETATLLRTIRARVAQPGQKLALVAGGTSVLRLAYLASMDHRWVEAWGRRLVQARISWTLADPFWYADTSLSHSEALAGDGTITVNTGSRATWWMAPTITIKAPAGASVPSVTLTNTTDSGIGLVYSDPGLANGASASIDCGTGSVTRGGSSSVRYLTGRPLRLLPGVNVLSYAGAACSIDISWIERWI